MSRPARVLWFTLLILLLMVVVWQATAEIIEPTYSLYIAGFFRPESSRFEVPTIGGTALRLYADPRPHIGKIASLQKGLVWVWNDLELIEEGYGFGCPLIVYRGQTYTSRHAGVALERRGDVIRLIKRYAIDTVDTPIQPLKQKYQPVLELGYVSCIYDIHPNGVIDVTVDLVELGPHWDKAYLMNEQGAHWFTRYIDDTQELGPESLSIWEPIAEHRACFQSERASLSFCVEVPDDATLYRGRERYMQRNWRGLYYLSWSGIDVEIEGPRPTFHYRLVLGAGS